MFRNYQKHCLYAMITSTAVCYIFVAHTKDQITMETEWKKESNAPINNNNMYRNLMLKNEYTLL